MPATAAGADWAWLMDSTDWLSEENLQVG
jgi:hypothetical protein